MNQNRNRDRLPPLSDIENRDRSFVNMELRDRSQNSNTSEENFAESHGLVHPEKVREIFLSFFLFSFEKNVFVIIDYRSIWEFRFVG